jgi:hypothetical protein
VTDEASLVAAGELARVERHGQHLALGDAQLHAPPAEPRVERVVVGVDADVRVGRHPGHPAPFDVGSRLRQKAHPLALFGWQIEGATAQRAVQAPIGPPVEPAVELVLEVERAEELTARLEARLEKADQALH